MTFLSVTGLVFLGLLALAALYVVGWLIVLGITEHTMNVLKRAGVVTRAYGDDRWVGRVKDLSDHTLDDYYYRPSKTQVGYMIENALAKYDDKAHSKGKRKAA
jgi:hypothetical protein